MAKRIAVKSTLVSVTEKLDRLGDERLAIDDLNTNMEHLIDEAFQRCPDLAEQYEVLQAEVKAHTDSADQLSTDIRTLTLPYGETIKGETLMAVWSKGRTSWDTKKLDGYAVAHPEIKEMKSEGNPSISIKEVK